MDSIRSGRHPDQRRVELRREQVVDVARGMTLIGVVPPARISIAPRAKHLSRPASAVCSRAGYPRRVRQVKQVTADDRVDGDVGTTSVLASVSRATTVDVFEAHDVILVEIGSRLDLDKEGRDLSGISEPVLLTNPNVGGLVFGE